MAVISDDETLPNRTGVGLVVPPSCPVELSPVLYVIPPQILSRDLARLKRLDPDAPRELSKVIETW
jgi:glutamine---fructose-6-phosphate transaminase (isomerizing)